jgi:cytochrome c
MASSLETNKALAALLTAGIIASGSGVISRIIYHPSMPEENAYVIEVVAAEGGDAAEATAPPLPVLLAAASPEAGAGDAKKCAACHAFEQGGAAKIGPPLWGVVGRDIASAPGFAYSDTLMAKDGNWDFDQLNAFLTNPKNWAPGTKMAFAGIKKPEDRADVLVYLRSLADSPVPLPEATEAGESAAGAAVEAGAEAGSMEEAGEGAGTAVEDGAEAEPVVDSAEQQVGALESRPEVGTDQSATAAGDGGIVALLAHADAEEGARDARLCRACHSFEAGGAAKIGPPLWGVVGRDIASVDGFSYSGGLTGKDGQWTYQALDDYLAAPRDWAPGTKMAFVGIKKPEDRANVILYLRSLSNDPAPLP